MVIPLGECIARPGERPGGLVTHLQAVARVCGDRNGDTEAKLAFLAGLAHDAAKAAAPWQAYIRGQSDRGPPHAPLGAALFAVWSERLIDGWTADRREREHLQDLVLDWVRVIYRHHGRLDDLDVAPPWTDPSLRVEHDCVCLLWTCDAGGLDGLIRESFPEYTGSLQQFLTDLLAYENWWRRRADVTRGTLTDRARSLAARDRLGLRLARLGGRLIYADRLHAAEWQPDEFASADAEAALRRHTEYCDRKADEARRTGASEELIQARARQQHEAVRRYTACRDNSVFTLLLPTGYGKTLTGLRVALEAVRSGRCRRLIYVAPYLSILAQAVDEIEKATGLPVFVHHHLSILQSKADPREDAQAEDHQPYDLMDTWQAPVVATTFNQLFRALFPSRAQECVRQRALDGAFVFIDEPQIVDLKVWCAFLRATRLMCMERGSQMLFSTATLPEMADGLGDGHPPVALADPVTPVVSRYTIRTRTDPWTVSDVAREADRRRGGDSGMAAGSVACILNTVRDAVEVYARLSGTKAGWGFLAAMMLPGHKLRVIRRIKDGLKAGKPVGVVCTQVLEAGVDLSFRAVLRARPIFSSVAQAAGRANRHGEAEEAEVVVFPFVREGGKESRKFVYRDVTARTQTDRILAAYPELAESEVPAALADYYEACWRENPHTGSLAWFAEAARGKWTALGGLEPFGVAYPMQDIFIPGAEDYLMAEYGNRMRGFGAATAEELLAVYLDRVRRRAFDFRGRKVLSALLRQFIVSFPRSRADTIAEPIDTCTWLWRLKEPARSDDEAYYSCATGLAHHLIAADAGIENVIF